jgi:trehalose 6-phosphate phosphatase
MADPEYIISREHIDAVLFDLDGVLTRTAKIHAAAWKTLFDDYLSKQMLSDPSPFDPDRDYHRYVDGKPRQMGVKHFLQHRGIDLPMGHPDDPPERETIHGLGNRKNLIFKELLQDRGVGIYGCALNLIDGLRKAGIKTAVVTASKNCDLILEKAGIGDLFDTRVDGNEAQDLDLSGKPDADTFLEAARRLGVTPERACVVEDAIAGVTAGHRGRFGLVIGIDRTGQRDALLAHGADVVFEDLCGIEVADIDKDPHPDPDPDRDSAPPELTDIADLAARLAELRPALFLDYDGTLTPIVDRPEEATLLEDMRRILGEAARVMPVAVISGRDLADVRRMVNIPEIVYAGSHGFEIQGQGLDLELPEGVDALDELEQAARILASKLAPIPGARLERKRFALAVHYRQVAAGDRAQVKTAVESIRSQCPGLRLTGGKKIHELRPEIDWDKGHAIRWLLAELNLDGPDVLPIYIGDDETDEDAFRALHGRGLGILVADRPRPSAADYRVRDTEVVTALLRDLVAAESAGE